MAGHHLIEAYGATMARALPAPAAGELADGLAETYQRHLDRGLDPDTAAGAAIAEFGEPDVVLAAFVRQSPGRRVARTLLYCGPAVGACWALVLVAGHAWTWPLPVGLRLAFGMSLLAVIGTLAVAATARRSYRRTRVALAGGLGLIALDAAVLATVLLVGRPHVWALALAVPASLVRMVLTAGAVPRLLTR